MNFGGIVLGRKISSPKKVSCVEISLCSEVAFYEILPLPSRKERVWWREIKVDLAQGREREEGGRGHSLLQKWILYEGGGKEEKCPFPTHPGIPVK